MITNIQFFKNTTYFNQSKSLNTEFSIFRAVKCFRSLKFAAVILSKLHPFISTFFKFVEPRNMSLCRLTSHILPHQLSNKRKVNCKTRGKGL